MKQNAQIQYTLRSVPATVDKALKMRAKQSGKSFNRVAVEALTIGVGQTIKPQRDFSFIIGSMTEAEAARLEEEIQVQRTINKKLWQ